MIKNDLRSTKAQNARRSGCPAGRHFNSKEDLALFTAAVTKRCTS